ncbi:HTH-type transcriptional regulator HmrR [Desulfosporosinus acididurans]|uniref:HTH-type transcriptional regulator HmrR n=1 Tax=Desulfosporosinus acididurans TaxID=476652 RepID=A0A0J1IG37_9FIRM|nr:helix-turn-helix domain-containing protein [Desulfosporosinus acididurans]KLU63701.1 HTH-type transcriptional regulator HmrR [Desulfosporosinus acididurans]
MNINEASKVLGCSSETLRKYERNFGLKIQRNTENYRDYSDKDIETFRNILDLKERGLSLAQIKDILDRTVEVQEQKIEVIKKSEFNKLQGKDFETLLVNILNKNFEGTDRQLGALQNEMTTGFSNLTQKMDTIIQRQDEIIQERNQKIVELEAEIQRLKNLKWWQRR